MSKIIVLSSKKNFSWTSMQEIIPFIEQVWCKLPAHSVELVNFDEIKLKKFTLALMKCEKLVLTCFTVEMAIAISKLRNQLGLNFDLIFYVHGMASIGYWPLFEYGLADCMKDSDTLVVTCEGDIRLTRKIFPKIKILKHPFLNNRETKLKLDGDIEEVVYIGRISEQKNLHLLIEAVKILKLELKNKKIKLRIFGGEDNLGSPNMGKESSEYLKYLKKLVKEYELNDLVKFEGHVTRDKLDNYLENTNVLMVIPSLHSDENFGMSPYNILKKGGRCILSNWGGFSEFKEYFGDHVNYLPIHRSKFGPVILVKDLAKWIIDELDKKSPSRKSLKSYYSYKSIHKSIRNLLETSSKKSELTINNEIINNILKNRKKYLNSQDKNQKNYGAKIFSDYQSELAHEFLYPYAAKLEEELEFDGDIRVINI